MPKRRLVVRRYRAKLTDAQLALLDDAIAAQNPLFNHALTRLYRMYGHTSRRRFPGNAQAIRSLRSKLIASYLEEVGALVSKKTGKPRWNANLMGMSSHRDVNAAKNILAWGLDPSNHAKHITLGIDPTLLVVKI